MLVLIISSVGCLNRNIIFSIYPSIDKEKSWRHKLPKEKLLHGTIKDVEYIPERVQNIVQKKEVDFGRVKQENGLYLANNDFQTLYNLIFNKKYLQYRRQNY